VKVLFKKALAVLLVMVFVGGVVPLVVNAATIPAGYTPIFTAQDLDNIRNNTVGNYILMNDIDLGGWGNWIPIDGRDQNDYKAFSGILDGNGFAIRNMTIVDSGELYSGQFAYAGLFAIVNSGEIKNLNIINASIVVSVSYDARVGGVAGITEGSVKFSNCSFSGNINVESYRATIGGIIGESAGDISNCYNWGNISAEGIGSEEYGSITVGGIAGKATGSIVDCYNWGSVSAENGGRTVGNVGTIASGIVGMIVDASPCRKPFARHSCPS